MVVIGWTFLFLAHTAGDLIFTTGYSKILSKLSNKEFKYHDLAINRRSHYSRIMIFLVQIIT